jgi:NAD(P)-dependent dehydrogenase (short-subunit alcohol dehydrogenase family)
MQSVFGEGVLTQKNVMVLGGTSGINLTIAQRFARAGARVAVLGRDEGKAERAANELRQHGREVMGLSADVRDYRALDDAMQRACDQWGELDIVVNGAAGNFPAPAERLSSNGFSAVVDIDLVGTFHGCRAAFGRLRKPGGVILNISATQAFLPAMFQAHVCAAKAGVDMLTRVLALEWGVHGVRVNSIAPGPIAETEGMRRLAPTDELADKMAAVIPLRRFGRREEVAEAALFLCSPAASYVTGAVLVCDGGQSLQGYGALFDPAFEQWVRHELEKRSV